MVFNLVGGVDYLVELCGFFLLNNFEIFLAMLFLCVIIKYN